MHARSCITTSALPRPARGVLPAPEDTHGGGGGEPLPPVAPVRCPGSSCSPARAEAGRARLPPPASLPSRGNPPWTLRDSTQRRRVPNTTSQPRPELSPAQRKLPSSEPGPAGPAGTSAALPVASGGHVVAFGRRALSSGSDLGRPVGRLRLVLALASTSSSGQYPRTRPVGGALWADDSQVTCKPWRGAKSRVREARPG